MNDLSSPSGTTDINRYRMADVAFFPFGDRRVLAHAQDTDATCLLQEATATLLAQCSEFKTLDEHVDVYCQQQQLSDTTLETIRYKLRCQLQQLAREGYLISSSHIRNLFQRSKEQVSASPITSIVFPTANRVEALQRCMTSYIEHCQCFGRSPDFVIADNSEKPAMRDAYRDMLRTLQKRYGVNIAYAGLEEKTAFVKKLSEVGDIPEEIVSWACLGDRLYDMSTTCLGDRYSTSSVGANRNILLLHTIGECIFTTDDDVICQVASSPSIKEGLALSSRGDVAELWFYPDRDNALGSVQFVEQDMLALHEQWLGQDPKAAIASYNRDDLLSFEQAEPSFLRSLATRPSKIAVTAHGMIGDAGWGETAEFLLCYPDKRLKQLEYCEQKYRLAKISREIAQVVNQVTIVERAIPLNGICIGGLDNRELLPPFPPVGACEDIAFGLMLTKCFPDAYTVHLPWMVIHAPLERRSYSESTFDIPFYDWIPMCIGGLFDARFASTLTDRLSKLGQFFDEIGRLPTDSFAKFARRYLWQARGMRAQAWEQWFRTNQEPFPAFWRRDIEAYCESMRQNMLRPIEQVFRGGLAIIQRLFIQFAQILKWWPVMVETARSLRAEGYRLAQPI